MSFLWYLWALLIWWALLDHLLLRRIARLKAERAGAEYEPGPVSAGIALGLPILTVLLLIRQFAIDVYHVPTASMAPTLEQGDRIFVDKLAFGLSVPFTGETLGERTIPDRGEVVVFRYPNEPKTAYVKRVVAVPGDVVHVHGASVSVNGDPVPWAHASTPQDVALDGTYQVTDGRVFVLGDNLPASQDSRHWGLLSTRLLIGEVID